jgi:trans-aconitate 2-methyltransferase
LCLGGYVLILFMPQSHEWDSKTYHELSQPQVSWGAKVLPRLPLRGDETVLDVGCGTGRLTAELLQRVPHGRIIAVDLSWNMLQSARAHLLPRFDGRISFLQADMQQLPLSDAAEGIFSTAAFHWARDHERLFAGLFRALVRGGWLEAQCGGGPNLARVREHAKAVMATPEFKAYFAGWAPPWEYADPETAAGRLQRAGFAEVKTWLEPSPQQFPGPAEFSRYLGTVTFHRHLERLPSTELRDQFLDRVARLAAKDDPPFVMDYWRLNMSARKPK